MSFSLEATNIAFGYAGIPLFRRINFSVPAGSLLMITGRSGCGKSTLLEICAGLKHSAEGHVCWNGVDISELSRGSMLKFRCRTGYVFQQHALISNFTVAGNIGLPLKYHERFEGEELAKRVSDHMAIFGILHLADKRPEELSVGQARLVSIARAFVMSPHVVFMDEPLSGLDPHTAETVSSVLAKAKSFGNVTMLIVSHEPALIKSLDSNVLLVENGTAAMHHSSEIGSGSGGLADYFRSGY